MHLEVSAPKRSVDSVVSSLSLWSHAREVRVIVSDDQPHASIGRPLSSPSYKFLAYDGAHWKTVNLADAVGGRLALRAPLAE